MKTIPDSGTRVKYTGNYPDMFEGVGTVIRQYRGGDKAYDEETGEHYITPHSVAIEMDKTPKHWPYESNVYAPDISDIELINEG